MEATLTRDVILDLVPVYLAGEASEETKALVEAFAARDPYIKRLLEAGDLTQELIDTQHTNTGHGNGDTKTRAKLRPATDDIFGSGSSRNDAGRQHGLGRDLLGRGVLDRLLFETREDERLAFQVAKRPDIRR